MVLAEAWLTADPRAEYELFNRIHALSKRDGKRRTTTIFISHRFSTVRVSCHYLSVSCQLLTEQKADKIAFVEDGVSHFVSGLYRA